MLYANVCLLLLKPYSTEHEDYVSKVIDVFLKNLFISIGHIKKKHQVPITFLSLH